MFLTMQRALFIAVVLLAPYVTGADPGGIRGAITDSEGAAIARAQIYIHWDPAGAGVGLKDNVGIPRDATTSTDKTGHYSVSLPPGFYDVMVSASAFSPQCRKVRVRANQFAAYEAKLAADPLVSSELAH